MVIRDELAFTTSIALDLAHARALAACERRRALSYTSIGEHTPLLLALPPHPDWNTLWFGAEYLNQLAKFNRPRTSY